MKPIYDDPFRIPADERIEIAMKEIEEFMKCDAKYAEVPDFEKYSMSTSMEIYKKTLRKCKIKNVIVRQKQGKIILCKA